MRKIARTQDSRRTSSDKGWISIAQGLRTRGGADLAYFGIQFAVTLSIGSDSLRADDSDLLEGSAPSFLILAALALLWMLWRRTGTPVPQSSMPLGVIGTGAFPVNLFRVFLLARYRSYPGSLAKVALHRLAKA